MNSFKIVLLCLSILTVSCKNNSDGKIETEVSSVAQAHAHGDEEIQLNQGQKWKVDAEMLSIIRTMENWVLNRTLSHYYNFLQYQSLNFPKQ